MRAPADRHTFVTEGTTNRSTSRGWRGKMPAGPEHSSAKGSIDGSHLLIGVVSAGTLPVRAGFCCRTSLDSTRDNEAGPPDGRSRHWLPANRKRRLVEEAQMRCLPSRADAALGAERSPAAGVRDRQAIPGGYDRVPAGPQGQVAGLEDLSRSGGATRPAPAGPRTEHGAAVSGR